MAWPGVARARLSAQGLLWSDAAQQGRAVAEWRAKDCTGEACRGEAVEAGTGMVGRRQGEPGIGGAVPAREGKQRKGGTR